MQEVKKADVLKTQLEAYRRQVQDLQLKLTEETKRGDKLEFDVKRLQEKLTVSQQDKEVIILSKSTFQMLINELICPHNSYGCCHKLLMILMLLDAANNSVNNLLWFVTVVFSVTQFFYLKFTSISNQYLLTY